jgi:hypothetical protein
VFIGRAVDVLVCRATGDSLIRTGRAAQLVVAAGGRKPVLTVTAADASGPSRPMTARLRLLEPHAAAVVVLPFVRGWRELAAPLDEVQGLLAVPHSELPRSLRGYAGAAHNLRYLLHGRSPAVARPIPGRATIPPPRPSGGTDERAQSCRAGPGPRGTAGSRRATRPAEVGDVAGVLGIFICALMLIIGRRNRSATAYEGLVGSAWVIGGLALASVAALLAGAFQI